MTYKTLINDLNKFNPEMLNKDVTIRIDDDFYPIQRVKINLQDDVLDANSIYLEV